MKQSQAYKGIQHKINCVSREAGEVNHIGWGRPYINIKNKGTLQSLLEVNTKIVLVVVIAFL